jgi:hypothetical protein
MMSRLKGRIIRTTPRKTSSNGETGTCQGILLTVDRLFFGATSRQGEGAPVRERRKGAQGLFQIRCPVKRKLAVD